MQMKCITYVCRGRSERIFLPRRRASCMLLLQYCGESRACLPIQYACAFKMGESPLACQAGPLPKRGHWEGCSGNSGEGGERKTLSKVRLLLLHGNTHEKFLRVRKSKRRRGGDKIVPWFYGSCCNRKGVRNGAFRERKKHFIHVM